MFHCCKISPKNLVLKHNFLNFSLSRLLFVIKSVTYPVDIIFLDFQKAFDKVPHKRLLHKLAAHGIGGELLLWIENWLSGRKQRVTLNLSLIHI